jgi:putative oxidoreductase
MDKYRNLLGRLLLAHIFVLASVNKMAAYSTTAAYMTAAGVPAILLPLVILFELGGGVALVLGWETRWAALALAVFTVVAALIFHTEVSDAMQQSIFAKNLAIAGGLFLLSTYGPGELSLDHRRGREGWAGKRLNA